MSDVFTGFNPAPDVIRDTIDPLAAMVFGVVWRFSQMGRGQCDATLETIAKRAGFGTTAVRERLRALEAGGWIAAETRPGRPTIYHDSGRWVLQVAGVDQGARPQRQTLPPPQREALAPQREALATPTRGVALPQREALPKKEGLRNLEETREDAAAANASARETAAAAAAAPGQLASSGDDAVDSEPAAAPVLPEATMVAAFVEAMQTDVHALPDEVRRELVRHARRAVELGHRPADVPHAVTAWRRDLERGHRQTAVRPPRSGQVLDALVKWARTAPAAPLFAADDTPPQPEAAPPTAADGAAAPASANVAPAPRPTSVAAPSTAPPIPPTAMLWPEPHLGPLLEALGYTPASCPPGERLLADRLLSTAFLRGISPAEVVEVAERIAPRLPAASRQRVREVSLEVDARVAKREAVSA